MDHLNPIIGDIVFNGEKYIHLTEENVNQYQLSDVYLPLPGFDVLYPKYVGVPDLFRIGCLILSGTSLRITSKTSCVLMTLTPRK